MPAGTRGGRARFRRGWDGFAWNVRVREPGGFYLPNDPYQGKFKTPSRRAKFTVHPRPSHDLAGGRLLLTTLRSHDQFNTTIYGHDDRYRGISGGRHVVMVYPDDITAFGLSDGDLVDLVSTWDDGSVRITWPFTTVLL